MEVTGTRAQEFAADHILIATGSEPAGLPGFAFDGTRIVSSDEALAFDTVPERLKRQPSVAPSDPRGAPPTSSERA